MKILLSMDWFKMAGVKQRNTKHEEKLATGFVFHFNDGYFLQHLPFPGKMLLCGYLNRIKQQG